MKRVHYINGALDAIDIRILEILSEDARTPMRDLAQKIGLSAPSTSERVRKLEDAGVIRGYHVDLDPKALGWPIAAVIRIRPMPGQLTKIAELAASMPQVSECHRITGEDCFILKVYLTSIESIDQILDRFLAFGQTTTSLVQSSPVACRQPPLPSVGKKPVGKKPEPAKAS